MKTLVKPNGDCRRFEELALDLAEGREPSTADSAFMQVHLADCPACRAENRVSSLLADTDEEGVAEPLDQVSRLRMINAVLERASASSGLSAAEPSQATANPGASLPGRIWAAAAAVLLVGGVTLGLLYRASLRDRTSGRQHLRAQLLLKSGGVDVGGAAIEVGGSIRTGQTLRVVAGRAALGLPGPTTALLGPGSRLRMVRLTSTMTEIHLLQGTLLATLPPHGGRPRFAVSTPAGRVEVTGTIFQVKVQAGRVAVAVLRGEVQVREPGQPARPVGRGLATVLMAGPGARRLRPLTVAEERQLWPAVRTLSLLTPPSVTTVHIDSRPAGALVRLDTMVLGQTPLSARVPTGAHQLMVERNGYRPVREQILFRSNEPVRRDYSLDLYPAPATQPPRRPAAATRPRPKPMSASPHSTAAIHRVPRRPPETVRPTPAPPSARPTARAILSLARRHRSSRRWSAAAMAYQSLIRQHPASPEARSARVSLGLILLDHLSNAAGALRLFSGYLAQTQQGALAQEAAYGRIRALHRLGHRTREIAALRDFLRRYPNGLQAPLVRRRLKQLRRPAP